MKEFNTNLETSKLAYDLAVSYANSKASSKTEAYNLFKQSYENFCKIINSNNP